MTAADRQAAAARQRRHTIALWRWALTEPAMDPALTSRQRGAVVRDLASREHQDPDGRKVTGVAADDRPVGRRAPRRRVRGPGARHRGSARRAPANGDRGAGSRAEDGEPGPHRGAGPPDPGRPGLGRCRRVRTIQRWLEARELTTRPGGQPPEAFGRFQADDGERDLDRGPDERAAGRPGQPSFLAGIIDDRSRFLTGARFVRRPDAVRFAGVLRAAVAAHGVPRSLYADNGSAFTDSSLERACAVLGIRLTHSQPGRPMGRGKIERVFETIQQQFLAEVTGDDAHPAAAPGQQPGRAQRPARPPGSAPSTTPGSHSETGEAPQARLAGRASRGCRTRRC